MGMFAYGRRFVKPNRRSKPDGALKEVSQSILEQASLIKQRLF